MDFNIRPSVFSLKFAGGFGCATVPGKIVLIADVTRRVVASKSNTGRGQFAGRFGRGRLVKQLCSRSICSRLRT